MKSRGWLYFFFLSILETVEAADQCADETTNGCNVAAGNTCNEEADNPGPPYTCSCIEGWDGDGSLFCTDAVECDINIGSPPSGICGDISQVTCTNTIGSFTCQCSTAGHVVQSGSPGLYSTTTVGNIVCGNADECTDNTHNCCTHTGCSACVDADPGFTCGCEAGYTGDGTSCADEDECAAGGSHNCGDTSGPMSCNNLVGSFECVCDAGYNLVSGATNSCVDIDECDDGTHECCAVGCTCDNNPGSYGCTCDTGYETDGTDYNCVNTNECNTPNKCGTDVELVCTDLDPSFSCDCNPGYTMNTDGGGVNTCVNDNECTDNTHNCCTHAGCSVCVDTTPGFTCGCEAGYIGDGTSCADVDECAVGGSHNCGDTSGPMSCNNLVGSFECVCDAGYNLVSGATNSCVDIDECDDGTHECCAVGCSCLNNAGSYGCTCDSGYETDGTDYNCVNTNECNNVNQCGTDAQLVCTDLDPFFSCDCNPGWTMNTDLGGTNTCVNDNECTDNTHNCCIHAGCSACVDAEPGFTCGCDSGYLGDGTSCVDENECADGTHTCGDTDGPMSCNNLIGTFECICDSGYTLVGGNTCVNDDECTDNTHNCCTHVGCSACVDATPGFTCGCDVGYRGDGTDCVDIDECAEVGVATLCGAHSLLSCSNTIGSFTCSCIDGYSMTPSGLLQTCDQIDECTDGTHDCVTDATGICNDKDPNVDGIKFECGCVEGYYGTGFANGQGCIELIDECDIGTHNCDANADCTNTQAAFTCACHAGFTDDNGDGTVCTNIDECTDGTDNCSDPVVGGICTDNPGSFVCSCDDAISYDEFGDGLSCILKVDECADNTHSCDVDATCTDTIEAFECACNAGYDGPGWFCYNVDECKEKGADIFGEAGAATGVPLNYADFVAQLDFKASFKSQPAFAVALEDEFVLEASFMIGNTGNQDKFLFSMIGQADQFIPNLPVDERYFFDLFEVMQNSCVDPAQGATETCFLSLNFDTMGANSDTTLIDNISVPYAMNNTCADYDAIDGCPQDAFVTISRQRLVDADGNISYTMLLTLDYDGVETQAATTHTEDHRMTEFQFTKTAEHAALMTSFFINQAG